MISALVLSCCIQAAGTPVFVADDSPVPPAEMASARPDGRGTISFGLSMTNSLGAFRIGGAWTPAQPFYLKIPVAPFFHALVFVTLPDESLPPEMRQNPPIPATDVPAQPDRPADNP